MALLPYEPFRQIDDWRRGLVRLFDEGFWREMFTSVGPRVDVYETADEVVVQCELPGLAQQDDVSITVDNNQLTIAGVIRRHTETAEDRNLYRQERFYGRFSRTLPLPAPVQEENIRATYKNGILEIRLPKAKTDRGRRIPIEFQ